MFPIPQEVTPVLRGHMNAQVSFANALSKSLFASFKDLCGLNIQLTQTMLEEAALAGQQLSTSRKPTDAFAAAASRAQPATEKLRAYQQHLSRISAEAQVDLARVTEEHVNETTHTSQALAAEVNRVASEELERNKNIQQEAVRQFVDPFVADSANKKRNEGTGAGRSSI